MFKFIVSNDEGLAFELETKPRDILKFERASGVELSELEEGISYATLYHLAWMTFKRVVPGEAPSKLSDFEKDWDVDPKVELEDADPTHAEA